MSTFTYRDGDVVPRGVTRVVVHPSVRVLPPGVFSGREELEEIQLHEGLEVIGRRAFRSCRSLRRLHCPSTVVRIGWGAFCGCNKLEEIQLREGLEDIGANAFWRCVSLRRLSCPSTVVRIGWGAFDECSEISVLKLAGIIEVAEDAFDECDSLERIAIPSRAFMVEVDEDEEDDSLERIAIPSRAFMVEVDEDEDEDEDLDEFLQETDRNYTCRLVTDGTIAPTSDAFVLIAPGCLTTLPESNLTELGNSIGTIMNSGEGVGGGRRNRICQEVRKEVQGEVSTILGLAYWRGKIDEAERGGEGALTRGTRVGCRGAGKGKVIAESVLPFLDALW